MSSLGDVKEDLGKLVTRETYKDIEDFLSPHFDANRSGEEKRHWRIVRDGHGRWREIKPPIDTEEEKDTRRSRSVSKRTRSTPNSKLLFSNNILNCAKSSLKVPSPVKTPSLANHSPRPCSSDFSRQDYSYLSTATRSNIFPGVGSYDWHSQSSAVHTESALNLGEWRGYDVRQREEFYGITKDAMGAWNEASVHHERMKKSWDVYLESLAKVGNVVTQLQTHSNNTKLKVQEINSKPKKQVKKATKKKPQKQRNYEEHSTEQKECKINIQNEEQVAPNFSEAASKDDDFWDFFEQPFVKS